MNERIAWHYRWRRYGNAVLNWVFPVDVDRCVLCGRPVVHASAQPAKDGQQASHMCLFCLQDARLCKAQPASQQLQLRRPYPPMNVYSCLPYNHFIRNLIRSWKYDGVMELTSYFGDMVAQTLQEFTRGHSLHFDVAVPVPSTVDRTRKRGYDHVRLLLHHVTKSYSIRTALALTRLKVGDEFTQSQTAKSQAQRALGLEKVYAHNKQVSVRGSDVLLIDDIVTSGATLASCANRLYRAGASSVCAIVIARVL
ncbi:phosphoribosyltransferase family protein [Alicyclobacillus fastidiosus]|uniref:Phosphoribosyltransferase family protein n=1 Tax=Alicyclobacillus fastidiosus TaxID=392011 RepID=A0ABY6ZI88_9BACL|nr:phosphoribosyltransferase family protein [Alicyclobacillus fastidiosus]WAH42638.1 phosphoribosyltransferase family protein [Alicyclobacillus fastidiosus]GMA64511.1 amidophosphoribosyltransferase [Alicyclobacillus fastidiosus]